LKGAASLFAGLMIRWGPPVESTADGPTPICWESRFDGAGLFAIEISSGHVYALVFDREGGIRVPPTWVRLP
jgi:hypothetical protein